jgi:hypothetical protein
VIVSVMLMELAIVGLLLGWIWVVIAASPWPAPWLVLLAGPLALIGGRLVPYGWRRRTGFDAAWWATVAVVVAALAEIGNAIGGGAPSGARWNVQFVAGLVLAWRGWALAEGWVDRDLVEAELQAGMLVVLGVLLVMIWVVPGAGLLPAVGFAAAGLFGLGIARRAERRDPRASLESDWLVLVGGLVVLVVAVAAAVVALITPDLLLALVHQVQAAVVLAISGIGALFQWIGSLFPVGAPVEQPPAGAGGGPVVPTTPPPASVVRAPPDWLFELIVTFAGVVFLALAIPAVYRMIRQNLRPIALAMPRQRDPAQPLSAADAFSWRGWWRVVLAWLRGWLAGGRAATRSSRPVAARSGAALAEQRSIRALYRELLAVLARAGFERQPSTTPHELARAVNAARPAASPAMSTLTELYVRTRYGEEPLGREELSRMRAAVQQARRSLSEPVSQAGEPGTLPTER